MKLNDDFFTNLELPKSTPHKQIFNELLKQFETIDFLSIVFPEQKSNVDELKALQVRFKSEQDNSNLEERISDLKEKLSKVKVLNKHYIVISIENVIYKAETNYWGLCKNHDFIYLFNGAYWSEIDKDTLQKFLGESAEKMGVPKFDARYHQFKNQLFMQFLSTAYLPTPEPDNDVVNINLLNGTFEISHKGNVLRGFKSDDFLTYQLPFSYNPTATAPIFEAYLNKVLPDIERQNVLSEFLGYIFLKNKNTFLKEEKALILYGTGANGKSVFFEIVNALLGSENITSYSLQSLTEDKGYYRAKIANVLLNYASEINGKLETSIFKQLVSGEPVEARLPYGQPFQLTQYAKLIFNCNELPKDVEHTNAYFRRFIIIPFDVTIPEHEQDKQLHTKIIDNELSGVFNWILKGLDRLLKNKRFSNCEASKKAVEQYKTESDSVKLFIEENEYTKSESSTILLKELYQTYKLYCIEDGFKPVNKNNFRKRIEGFNILVERKNNGNRVYLQKPTNVF